MMTMIVKMGVATAFFVLLTVLLRYSWDKSRKGMLQKVLVGVLFGLACILSTHIGVDYKDMVLNVRDMGPLCAGLFFNPVSGIIAGLIGGVERYIAGTYFEVGAFTRIACSVSTCLAGLLAAFLHLRIFKAERPSIVSAAMMGSLMEVFHMYAVLLTHREAMEEAYRVVEICAVPMIFSCGLGMGICSVTVKHLSSEEEENNKSIFLPREETEIAQQLFRWLLAVMALYFSLDFVLAYSFHTSKALQSADRNLQTLSSDYSELYVLMSDNPDFSRRFKKFGDTFYVVYDQAGDVTTSIYSVYNDDNTKRHLSDRDEAAFSEHLGQKAFWANPDIFKGRKLLCRSTSISGGQTLVMGMDSSYVFQSRLDQMYENSLSAVLISAVIYILLYILVDILVVRDLRSVNRSLSRIIGGDLEETVSARGSYELSMLSNDINQTVSTLKTYIDASEKRMKRDLTLAATIQDSALPKGFSYSRRDFEIYALMKPAKEVGGDFYDFFFVDRDILVLVIADVSGKGIPASLFMMRSKTTIEQMARSGYSAGELLGHVNDMLCEGNDAKMFVTVWIGILNLETGLMKCANAGHEYPALRHMEGEYELYKDVHSCPLAVIGHVPMREYELQLQPGDRIFVYTDGVPETINEEEEQYGVERLIQILNKRKNASQQQLLQAVLRDVTEFAGKADQFDDITMLGLTYNGPEKSQEQRTDK